MTPFQRFAPQLRRLGFKKDWDSRAGGERCVIYVKQVAADRKVEVQIWANSASRASHMVGVPPMGRCTTRPTYFSTAGELEEAIRHESTRTDHPALPEGCAA